MQFILRANETQDDAGTYLLKKMGVWQRLHAK
jgi:hypothetical protein